MWMIGIDVGGTGIQAGLLEVDAEGHQMKQVVNHPTPHHHLPETLGEMVQELCQREGILLSELVGVGVAVPGWIDPKEGVLISASNLPFRQLPLAKELSGLLGGVPIKMDNDGNLAALGEFTFGAGQQFDSALVLMVGTGLGGALVRRGEVLDGELGHFSLVMDGRPCGCGLLGCAEAYCSASALLQQAVEQGMTVKNGAEFFALVAKEDRAAKQVLSRYIPYLATTIIGLMNLYRPNIVILGGGITGSGELLFDPLGQEIQERTANFSYKQAIVPIIPSILGSEIGIYGAAALFG